MSPWRKLRDVEWPVPVPDTTEFLYLTHEAIPRIQQNDPAITSLQVKLTDDNFWRVTNNRLDLEVVGRCIGASRVLRNLSFEIDIHVHEAEILLLFEGVKNNRSVETLQLNFRLSRLAGSVFSKMQSFFEHNTSLVRLDSISFMPSSDKAGIAKALSSNSSLKCVLMHMMNETVDTTEAICSRPSLTHLALEGEFRAGTCQVLSRMLTKQDSSLQSFNLKDMDTSTSDNMKLLACGIAANTSVKCLTLAATLPTVARGYRPISSIFGSLRLPQLGSTLKTLNLAGKRDNVNWGNVIEALSGLTSLTTLVLDYAEIKKNGFLIWGRIFNAVLGPNSTLEKLIARRTSMKLDSLRDLVSCLSRTTSLKVLDLHGSRDLSDDHFPSTFNTVWSSLFDCIGSSGCPLEELNINDIWLCQENNAALADLLRKPDNTLKCFTGNFCCGDLKSAVPLATVQKICFRNGHADLGRNLISTSNVKIVSLSLGEMSLNDLLPMVEFVAAPNCSLYELNTELRNDRYNPVHRDQILSFATSLIDSLRRNNSLKKIDISSKEPLDSSAAALIREMFLNLVNDKSSPDATCNSNHTLEKLHFGSILDKSVDIYVALHLNRNPDKGQVANEKILRNNASFDISNYDIKMLPQLMTWMGMYPVGLHNMHSVVLQIKDIIFSTNPNVGTSVGKRKREDDGKSVM